MCGASQTKHKYKYKLWLAIEPGAFAQRPIFSSFLSLFAMSCQQRVAMITGSAQGIGKAIALRLASDGYDLALLDIEAQKAKLEELHATLSRDYGRRAIIIIGDVTIEEDVENGTKETVDKLGSLDVVRCFTLKRARTHGS